MNTPPKNYAPHMTLQEMHDRKVDRLRKVERWTEKGLIFMTGVAYGTLIVGTFVWGF
jgi:hypothetical protein